MSKLFIAKVIDNNSLNYVSPDPAIPPATMNGRVQIYIAELHHGFSKDKYIWARHDREMTSNIPEIGDYVWVWFYDEVHWKKAFYKNKVDLLGKHDHGKTIGSITTAYPNVKYIRFSNGVAIGFSSVSI